eukprot:452636-Pelagomonas_calceolata.AAC.4
MEASKWFESGSRECAGNVCLQPKPWLTEAIAVPLSHGSGTGSYAIDCVLIHAGLVHGSSGEHGHAHPHLGRSAEASRNAEASMLWVCYAPAAETCSSEDLTAEMQLNIGCKAGRCWAFQHELLVWSTQAPAMHVAGQWQERAELEGSGLSGFLSAEQTPTPMGLSRALLKVCGGGIDSVVLY